MKILPALAAAATAMMIGSASVAVDPPAVTADVLTGIEWEISPAGGDDGAPSLDFEHRANSSTFSLDGDQPDLSGVRAVLGSPSSGGIAFTIAREPGTVACRGTLARAYEGRGTCSFAPDRAFEQELRARDLAPTRREDLLAMALLGVDRAMIDGFAREGVAPRSADEVIASAALGVTPGYVGGLKAAGLPLDRLEDAIAARALGVDAGYVRGMAEAGYRPTAEQIVAMKAVGVTPEYARRMNAAAQD